MDSLSIAQLSQFSGIKAHTIRMWEQRYDALNPVRTEGNTRIYSDLDLRRLLNIVSLMDNFKVSELCRMKDKALNSLVGDMFLGDFPGHFNNFVPQLINAGMSFDEDAFQKIFSHCILKYGVTGTYKKVIYPLLKRLGLLWTADFLPAAHEHFISNLIRQKLFTAIDSLPPAKENAKKWLLFLPEDEYHEIGLLFAHYLLSSNGQKVFYLGSSVPSNTISVACKNIKADALLLFFVHYDSSEKIKVYLEELSMLCKKSEIYVSGNEKLLSSVDAGIRVSWLKQMEDLEKELFK